MSRQNRKTKFAFSDILDILYLISHTSDFSEKKRDERFYHTDHHSARTTVDRKHPHQSHFFFDAQKTQNPADEQNQIHADQDTKKRNDKRK